MSSEKLECCLFIFKTGKFFYYKTGEAQSSSFPVAMYQNKISSVNILDLVVEVVEYSYILERRLKCQSLMYVKPDLTNINLFKSGSQR